jgi:hypothetical protein
MQIDHLEMLKVIREIFKHLEENLSLHVVLFEKSSVVVGSTDARWKY